MPLPSLRTRRLRPALAGAAALVLVLVAACSSSGPTTEPTTTEPLVEPVETGPRPGGTLDIAVPAAPAAWSPAGRAWSAAELQAARAVYDRLVVRDVDDLPTPDLAERVTSNDDYTVWTIEVREGVTFHDGSPLDGAAVAANLQAQRTSPDAEALLAPISGVEVRGSRRVVVTLSTPWSTFPQVLTTQVGYIAAPAVLDGSSPVPVGTGPFAYVGVGADGATTLEKNPSYWREGLPYLDGVRLVPITEAASRVDAALDGTVGLVSVDEPRQLSRIDDLGDDLPVEVVEDRNGERPKIAIAFDTGRAPFDHVEARRAVELATDRDEILEQVLDGQGTIARGPISDASPWFTDRTPPARDVDGAREMAAEYEDEAGTSLEFTLMVPPDPTIRHVASLWRAQLADAGIDVQLQPVEADALTFVTLTGQYQAALQVGFSDPHPDLYEPLFRGIPAEQPAVNTNITRYVNPVVTEAFADARSTDDVTRQVDDYRIVQEQLSIDDPYLFLVQVRSAVLASSELRDLAEWSAGSGSAGLSEEGATVSVAQVWIDPTAGEG